MRIVLVMGLCASIGAGAAWAAETDLTATGTSTERKDADDTARNARDRDGRTLTPMDQGGTESDRTITQEIRKAVTDRDELSTNARNVKIITVDGVVTLRGPVKSETEKTTVASLARRTTGVKRVDDQLEVERNP